jgi:hypothetical protein
MSRPQVKRLMTLPGVKLIVAATFVAAVGDIRTVSDRRKLRSVPAASKAAISAHRFVLRRPRGWAVQATPAARVAPWQSHERMYFCMRPKPQESCGSGSSHVGTERSPLAEGQRQNGRRHRLWNRAVILEGDVDGAGAQDLRR